MATVTVRRILSITLLSGLALGSVDYCRDHTFKNIRKRNYLVFSKENSEREYGIVYQFKSIHCCSHGFRSIEWFKNGKPYPWPTDVSTLIISPESGNQTIYSQSISEIDSGQYWCIVRNDTHSLRHDVFLKVSSSSELEGPPKATYRPKNKIAALGRSVRFYCEAFVGNISLPDAKSEISWRKLDINTNSSINDMRITQRIVNREGNQVLGSYLLISNVRKEDYGEYACRVSNTGDQFVELNASLTDKDKTGNIGPSFFWMSSRRIISFSLPLACFILITASLALSRSHFTLSFQKLFRKNYEERVTECDILVIYHADDKDTALNKIVFTLQNSYHYICNVYCASNGKLKLDDKDFKEKANHCKRIIVLLSSAITENEWCARKVYSILQTLIRIHPRIIAVFLKSLPSNEPKEQAEVLQALLERVYCISYNEAEVQKFWYLMTLGLPVPSLSLDSRENVELV